MSRRLAQTRQVVVAEMPADDAPYRVETRAFQRRLLRDALAFCGSMRAAARLLGISHTAFRKLAKRLGGVLEGDPVNEPYDRNRGPR